MAATVTAASATAVNLPVAYVDPGRLLAQVFANLDGWEELGSAMRTLRETGRPRPAYAYQPSQADRLLAQLVLDVTALEAGEEALPELLTGVRGLQVISVQPATEAGLVMAERQRPELAGTPAVIFGRAIISGLTLGIIEAQGEAGGQLLSRLGGDAGRLAASALPPLLKQLGITISDDLLARRIRDLQVIGWATFEHASIDAFRREVTLADTFEAAAWGGAAASPACYFLAGFIGGVFSFAWERPVGCRELERQAMGAARRRFVFRETS